MTGNNEGADVGRINGRGSDSGGGESGGAGDGQTTANNLKSLQTITSIGVISGVLGYLSASKLPTINYAGVVYFVILFVLTWSMNYILLKKYQYKKYSLKFGDRAKNL